MRHVVRMAVAGVMVSMTAAEAFAQSWVSVSDGSWGAAENWSGGSVPVGTALVTFTNAHSGTVTVTLDGDRSQTGGVLFGGGGDWSIQPGTPDTSALTLGGALTVSNDVVATLVVAGTSGVSVVKYGLGEWVVGNTRTFAAVPAVRAGTLRVTEAGTIRTGTAVDTYVDGTGALVVDGGRIDTKIIRIGAEVMADGALFRMTSGTVNCGGSGEAVLLVGYLAGTALQGNARAEILGGTFAATGLVANAGIYIGTKQNGTLAVAGSNGVPAVVDVDKIWFGWRDSSNNYATTNDFEIDSNAVVTATTHLSRGTAQGLGRVYLKPGGTLRTPTVYAAAGDLDFHFEGGSLEMTAPSNTIFTGSGMRVFVDADSVLDVDTNDVAMSVPLDGSASLTKAGTGALSFGGDQSGFSGTLAVTAGSLRVATNLTDDANMTVGLEQGSLLDLTSVSVFEGDVSVSGDASFAMSTNGATLSSLTLENGTLTLSDNDYVTILSLDVPTGADVTLACAGTVAVGSLTGGGTLTVAGGGTFNVVDNGAFVGSVQAETGTTLNNGATSISRMTVSGDQTLSTGGGEFTVDELTLAGGTLTTTGGGALALGSVTVAEGATASIALADGSAVTNIASLTLGADSVFEPEVADGTTLTVGAASGTGTLRLDGGTVVIVRLATDLSFDILSGEVTAQPAAGPESVSYTSGEPAFWVDASQTDSLVTVESKRVWRDRRYSESGPYDMMATATNVQPTVIASESELNDLPVVKFVSPSSDAYKGMIWSRRLTNIRTVFWVIGAQEGGGGLLGDESLIDYLRGEVPAGTGFDVPLDIYYAPLFSLKFKNASRDNIANVFNGVTRLNGQAVDAFRNGFPSPDYHLVSLRTAGDTTAKAFASERISGQNARSGCQRLAEALVFTNALTDAEIEETEAYLQAKWFGSAVRARSVRLGGADARFEAVGGAVIVDELRLDAKGLVPTNALSGVSRIDRLVVAVPGVTLGNAARTGLPFDIGALRVENGVTTTVDTVSADAVHLSELSGTGTVAVAGGTSVELGGVQTDEGDDLTVSTPSVPLTVCAWQGAGVFRVAGATSLAVNNGDLSGTNLLVWAGTGDLTLTCSGTVRASGLLRVEGNLALSVGALKMNTGGFALELDNGGRTMSVSTLYGVGTLAKSGSGSLVTLLVRADGARLSFACGTFANPVLPKILLNGGGLTVTGNGQMTVNELRTETSASGPTVFGAGVTMLVSNLNHTVGTFTFPTNGVCSVVRLSASDGTALTMPGGQTTTARTLVGVGKLTFNGGTLEVLDSFSGVTQFVINCEGLLFPDGTVLSPTQFDVLADAVIDLGDGSVLTLSAGGQTFSNSVAFVQGTVNITGDLTVQGTLCLTGTAVNVSAGTTVTTEVLTGDGSVTLAVGGVLTAADLHGFDGTIENDGGTVNACNDRPNVVPDGPVVEPTFWVDASEGGSLVTNSSTRLKWLDKRTVRDGASGLMYAVSSNMPTVLWGELNGLPVVDFGTLGTSGTDERGMTWSARLTDVRAVHWVIGAQNGGGQMLGDYKGGHIDYFRYSDQTTGIYTNNYGYGDYRTPLWSGTRFYTRELQKNIVDGTTYMDGEEMASPGFTDGFLSADYHLLSLRTVGSTWAAAFASERVGQGYGTRSGAQRLGEVLVYNGVSLTEEENRENDAYLSWKWFARLLPTYRAEDTDLVVLKGSGTFAGESVLAREIDPSASGLTVDGNLYLDFYSDAATTGAVIRLDELPDEGTAAIHVSGDATLASAGTVILGEARTGVFIVLQADGTLNGADNIANWVLDVSAVPSVGGYSFALYAQGDAVMLKIAAKGTIILLR